MLRTTGCNGLLLVLLLSFILVLPPVVEAAEWDYDYFMSEDDRSSRWTDVGDVVNKGTALVENEITQTSHCFIRRSDYSSWQLLLLMFGSEC